MKKYLILSLLNAQGLAGPANMNHDVLTAWYTCSMKIVLDARVDGANWTLPLTIKRHSVNKDPKFLMALHALIHTESRFKPNLTSTAAAYGLMQITDVGMREAAIQCRFPVIPVQKLFDTATNIRYGSCYLDYLLKSTGNLDRALIVYNGGYRQLAKYDQGIPMAAETSNHLIQTRRILALCKE